MRGAAGLDRYLRFFDFSGTDKGTRQNDISAQVERNWIPACAGMTILGFNFDPQRRTGKNRAFLA